MCDVEYRASYKSVYITYVMDRQTFPPKEPLLIQKGAKFVETNWCFNGRHALTALE